MTNGVIDRLATEREQQEQFVEQLLSRVDADGRDLVPTEQETLTHVRQRIQELDAQLGPLQEISALISAHEAGSVRVPQPSRRQTQPQPLGGAPAITYQTPGAFVVDYMAARGLMANERGQRLPADAQAAERIQYVLANQLTGDTPGLLPEPIVGTVVSLIDATRPFISSIGGGRAMGGIPGKTFGRPKVTQHVQVGVQAAEKTELPSRKMIIGEVAFTKQTFGGAVDVSRQDIDWTSPAAWDILIRDLADVYAQETENAAADGFVAAADDINTPTAVTAGDLAGWSAALYAAAGKVYASSKRLPDRLWVSVDVWGKLGPLTDTKMLVYPPGGGAGRSELSDFSGDMMGIPRIVVPSFPANTAIIGASSAYEVYEEVIGLLTAVEPSLLGVEVAYGGYIAHNAVVPEALAPLTPPVGVTGEAGTEQESGRGRRGG